jgi:hypothetical protein
MEHNHSSGSYVPDKVPVKGTFFWLGVLLLFVLVSILVSRLIYHPELIHIFGRYMGGEIGTFSSRQAPPNQRPRLQVDEIGDIENYRAKQEALLTQFTSVDQAGEQVIHIPIELAMKKTLEKGLPIRRPVK